MNLDKPMIVLILTNYFSLVINGLMIFGPCIGFLIQANKFKTVHSSKGFSLYVCLIILISNILRIYFWIGKRFTSILLAQSFVVIASQLYLIHVALDNSESIMTVTSKPEQKVSNDKEKSDTNRNIFVFLINNSRNVYQMLFSIESFWKWESFGLYLIMTTMLTIASGMIFFIFGFNNMPFIELVGSISTGIEVILAIPQIVCNYNNKSTETLSFTMVLLWFFGDLFKITYYLVTKLPIQFIVCSLIQIVFDVILLSQIVYFSYWKETIKQPNRLSNAQNNKYTNGYGTFDYSNDEKEEVIIKSKTDEDNIIIKDY